LAATLAAAAAAVTSAAMHLEGFWRRLAAAAAAAATAYGLMTGESRAKGGESNICPNLSRAEQSRAFGETRAKKAAEMRK